MYKLDNKNLKNVDFVKLKNIVKHQSELFYGTYERDVSGSD
jgi:hypothetical protein